MKSVGVQLLLLFSFLTVDQVFAQLISNPGLPVVQSTCNPSCDNIGFQNGNLSAWSAYFGINNSSASFVISSLTGGAAGAVTQSANDPNIFPITNPNATSSYQVSLIQSAGVDTVAGALIPLAPPLGGHCAMIGDGINTGQGVGQLEQSFSVSSSNPVLTIQYAVVLENPSQHTYFEQPFFKMEVLDASGKPIPSGCGNYSVVSGPGQAGYQAVFYAPNQDTAYCRPWTTVFVPLYNYVGQCITVRFQAADCSLGAHFGYAYVTCSCSNISLSSSSLSFCKGQKSVTITGSPGASAYKWSGPCVLGSSTQQILNASCGGTYQVIETSSAGPTCIDTLNITIVPSSNGPPPIPSFNANETCSGNPTQFTNTSVPLSGTGVKYYWDFYNNGQVNDSTQNPSWNFPQPGTYQVILHETNNGCGSDTSLTVVVDSVPNLFQIPVEMPLNPTGCKLCNGQVAIPVTLPGSIHFINNSFNTDTIFAGGGSTGFLSTSNFSDSTTYSVNFDTMTVFYKGLCPGKYSIYIYSPNPYPANKCSAGEQQYDTLSFTLGGAGVNLSLSLTTQPSECATNTGTASVNSSGGAAPYTYSWSNAAAGAINSGLVPGIYFLTVNDANGCLAFDTAKIISINTLHPITINGTSTICAGDSTILMAGGGIAYSWSNGETSASITVSPVQDSVFNVQISNGGCKKDTSISITVNPGVSGVACCSATIPPGQKDTLKVLPLTGSNTYSWTPATGLNCDNCPDPVASPSETTQYTLKISNSGGCSKTEFLTITVFEDCPPVFIPTAFSPNGDNENDLFAVRGTACVTQMLLQIFDRWGEMVWWTNNATASWDGNYRGRVMDQGVLLYKFTAKLSNGSTINKTGNITLLK